jgi:nitrogen fixation NifU-like protein
MSELSELYQEVILDHNKSPRNYRVMEDATRSSEGLNPLCGDQMTVYVKLDGNHIDDVAFQARGCAISKASASLMTEGVKGKTAAEAEELFQRVHTMLTTPRDEAIDESGLGKLAVLSGVREFPSRVKCASLSWHALRAALRDDQEKVSTE